MRNYQYIKHSIIMGLKQWKSFALIFLLMPIVMSFLFSLAFQSLYNVEPSPPKMSVYIENHDHSPIGQQLEQVFQELQEQSIFVQEETADKADFIIDIPSTYGQSLGEGDLQTIKVTAAPGVKQAEITVMNYILQPISNQIQEMMQIQAVTQDPARVQAIIEAVNQ